MIQKESDYNFKINYNNLFELNILSTSILGEIFIIKKKNLIFKKKCQKNLSIDDSIWPFIKLFFVIQSLKLFIILKDSLKVNFVFSKNTILLVSYFL